MDSRRNPTQQALDCGTVIIELVSNDAAVIDFAVEYFHPWFRPAPGGAEWRVRVTSSESAYAEMHQHMPSDASPQPCFAHDREVLSMPAWRSDDRIDVWDAERSCFLRLRPGQVDVIGDPRTLRWRFTLLWIVQEIVATRRRLAHVDVHAAATERAGRALLIAGPKGAGKTTLSLYLMRSCACRSIANDRSFVGGAIPMVLGMPTAVKIRPPTLAQFPELRSQLPPVARPYLYTLAELATASPSAEPVDAVDFALSPNQLAQRLGAGTEAAAPLGAIAFPQVCEADAAWAVERMTTAEVVAGIHGNLYGAATGDRPTTLFEQFDIGRCRPSEQTIAAIAARVPGHRVRLGRDAYADASLGEHLLSLWTT